MGNKPFSGVLYGKRAFRGGRFTALVPGYRSGRRPFNRSPASATKTKKDGGLAAMTIR
jgi:hypothetical protein